MDILYVIIYFLVMLIDTFFLSDILRVKKKRKFKWKIPREQISPIMDETYRIFIFYLMIIVVICAEMEVLSQVISDLQLLKILKYIAIVYIGFFIIMTCYGVFDYRKPKKLYVFCFNDSIRVKIRKSVLYILIALIAITNSCLKYANVETDVFRLINDTYLVCIIAFDRIINQIYDIMKAKNDEKRINT